MAKEQQISFGMSQPSASMHENYISKEAGGTYELGDFDQAFFMYLDGQENLSAQEQRETLNIFPSEPMHVEPSTKFGMSLGAPTVKSASKKSIEQAMDLSGKNMSAVHPHNPAKSDKLPVKKEGNRKATTSSSDHEGPKTPDAKKPETPSPSPSNQTLRRLAQNREAARKSRLRKKAYVQQLESCKMKLNQLEHEIQRARTQGVLLGGGILGEQGLQSSSEGAAIFDLEYARWLEEHNRLMMELRAAMQERLQDNELHIFVGSCLAHYNTLMNLKSMGIKADVFHVISGLWKTPAERCFFWLGGFCPSEIIKVVLSHIEPLTEIQLLGISKLQHSAQETEEALSQGLEALYQSLADTIVSNNFSFTSNMANYMGQMAIAMNKLSTLEGFVRQADTLRLETLHRLYEILTVRQSAKCLLAISEYFHRLRALSSLWLSRPRHE